MLCKQIDCPFFDLRESGCGLASPQHGLVNESIDGHGLFASSIEIGKALACRQRVSFLAKGTCMYPCIKQGDQLYVESCSIECAKVGDIAVVGRNGILFGHRIISKGVDKILGTWIVTRSDRSVEADDGRAFQDELLGIVSRAERRGKTLALDPVKLKGLELLKISFWEWWQSCSRPVIVRYLDYFQRQRLYRHLSSAFLCIRYPYPDIVVRVPLKPMQKSDLCQVFPVSGFDLNTVYQKGGEVAELMIQLEFRKKIPAARVLFIRRPDGCPEGGGWQVRRSWCRIRYRGAGLEERLIEEARKILGSSVDVSG